MSDTSQMAAGFAGLLFIPLIVLGVLSVFYKSTIFNASTKKWLQIGFLTILTLWMVVGIKELTFGDGKGGSGPLWLANVFMVIIVLLLLYWLKRLIFEK